MSKAIGERGLAIIKQIAAKKPGKTVNILTHCNAGWLATVDYGTALAPIYLAYDAGISLHVWVDETRPRGQGASLTAFELGGHGVKHTILADNAGGHYMQTGQVDLVIVGTDRVTANGDVANKIGTYLKALAARDNNVPFYVALPSSTIDWTLENGRDIPIEERSQDEVLKMTGRLADGKIATVEIAAPGSAAADPGFDVTPARLVTGLIRNAASARPAGRVCVPCSDDSPDRPSYSGRRPSVSPGPACGRSLGLAVLHVQAMQQRDQSRPGLVFDAPLTRDPGANFASGARQGRSDPDRQFVLLLDRQPAGTGPHGRSWPDPRWRFPGSPGTMSGPCRRRRTAPWLSPRRSCRHPKQHRVGPTPQTVRGRPVSSELDQVFTRLWVEEAGADHENDEKLAENRFARVFFGFPLSSGYQLGICTGLSWLDEACGDYQMIHCRHGRCRRLGLPPH